jgi:dTDP-4-dehydrorhamnose reductase
MIRAWEAGKSLRVVSDQTGSPTYTAELAKTIRACIERNLYPGIYHAAGPDAMSWYDLARQVLTAWRDETESDRPVEIEAILTSDWPTPAARPKYSVLSSQKLQNLGIPPMAATESSLKDFCRRLRSLESHG